MSNSNTSKQKRHYARKPLAPNAAVTAKQTTVAKKPKRETKIGKVIQLLQRKQGAMLNELIKATGWQPHTTRGAMSGLRKKGHTIKRTTCGDASCYRITAIAA